MALEPESATPLSKKALKEGIRDVLGGGSDIDAANPLPVALGAGITFAVDVTDRAARDLGLVRLNQGGSEVDEDNPLRIRDPLVLGELITRHYNRAVIGGNNILPAAIETTATGPVTWRIYVVFQAAGVFAVRRTVGGNTYTERMNGGGNLGARAAHTFDIIVEAGERIQLAYSIATTMDTLKIVEVW